MAESAVKLTPSVSASESAPAPSPVRAPRPLRNGNRSHRRLFRPILSSRGLIVALFCTYLLAGPAAYERDIVATVLALSLLSFTAIFAVITIVSSGSLRRDLSVFLSAGPLTAEDNAGQSGTMPSRTPLMLLVRIPPISIPPLYTLELRIEFEHPGAELVLHVLRGNAVDGISIPHPIRFPHRGDWSVRGVTALLTDRFGISRFQWDTVPCGGTTVFKIDPPYRADSSLPIISSTQRSGDEIVTPHDRNGDPYDLKPYHPSDGLRKVVWKVFARTGELVSRHPEPSMTPEGKTALFVAAGRNDEDLCAAAAAYARRLESLELVVLAGCEGQAGTDRRAPLPIARNSEQLLGILRASVWDLDPEDLLTDIDKDFESAVAQFEDTNPGQSIERVVLFVSGHRLPVSGYQNAIKSLAAAAHSRGITPVVALIAPAPQRSNDQPITRRRSAERFLRSWFTHHPSNTAIPLHQTTLPIFLSLCAQSGWEVLYEESFPDSMLPS